jgi:hypothetical protein
MHRARFLIVLSLVLIGLSVLAYVALLPSFVALETNTLSDAEINAQGSSASDSLKSMQRSQALLSAVSPLVYATSTPTAAIEKAISLRPKGATVQRIRYIGSTRSIQIAGVANRETLTAYRIALENDGMFSTVSVPVAALVGSSGQFSITLNGNF